MRSMKSPQKPKVKVQTIIGGCGKPKVKVQTIIGGCGKPKVKVQTIIGGYVRTAEIEKTTEQRQQHATEAESREWKHLEQIQNYKATGSRKTNLELHKKKQ